MRWRANIDGSECARNAVLAAHIGTSRNFEAMSPGVYKTVLHCRGVIQSDYLQSYFGNE